MVGEGVQHKHCREPVPPCGGTLPLGSAMGQKCRMTRDCYLQYLSVAAAAEEAFSDGGTLIASFQASVAALRSRTSSGHGVCASA
jgi:CRISPR/Cas system-associated exonuclease Cas4 (RecB family)